MKKNWIYRRGDIYLANLGVPVGSKQGGTRPVVILQNNTGNYFSPTVTIAPITSKVEKKKKQPTHFFIRKAKGLSKPSMVLAEQLDTCDKSRIIKYLGRVSWGQMRGIDEAVRVQLGYYIPERARREKQDEFQRKLETSSRSRLTKGDIVAQTQDINNNESTETVQIIIRKAE